jgi:hypothetical protein
VEVCNKEKMLKVSMKRLYDMLVQLGFLKKISTRHLKRGDYYEFHEKKGYNIDEYIEFRQIFARILTLRELKIDVMEDSDELRTIESQKKRLEVCRVQPRINRPPKLILTKPLYASKMDYNVMPYNYDISLTSKPSCSRLR